MQVPTIATNLVPFDPAYDSSFHPPYTNGVDEHLYYPPLYGQSFPQHQSYGYGEWSPYIEYGGMLPGHHVEGGNKRFFDKKKHKHKKKIVDEDDDDFVESNSKAKHGTLHKMKRAFKKAVGKHMLPGEFDVEAFDNKFPGPKVRPLSHYSDTVTPQKHAFKEFDHKFPALDIQPVSDYLDLAAAGKRAYKKTNGQQMFSGEFDAKAFENEFPGLEIWPASEYSDLAMAENHDAPFMDSKPRRGHMGPSASFFSKFFGGSTPFSKPGKSAANTKKAEHDEAPQEHMQGPRKYKQPRQLVRHIEDANFVPETKEEFDHDVARIIATKFDEPVHEKYTKVQEQIKEAQQQQQKLQAKLQKKMKFFEQEHAKRVTQNKENYKTHYEKQTELLKQRLKDKQEKEDEKSMEQKTKDETEYTENKKKQESEIEHQINEISAALKKIGDDESDEFKNTTKAIEKKLEEVTTSNHDDKGKEKEANESISGGKDEHDSDNGEIESAEKPSKDLASEPEASSDEETEQDDKKKNDTSTEDKKKNDTSTKHKKKNDTSTEDKKKGDRPSKDEKEERASGEESD